MPYLFTKDLNFSFRGSNIGVLPRYSKFNKFGDRTSVCAVVCSNAYTRLNKSVKQSKNFEENSVTDRKFELFSTEISLEALSLMINFIGVAIVVNIMLLILI
jgi:hypothetical protein